MTPRVFTVRTSQIDMCPLRSLLPGHYRDDGSCRCRCETPGCTWMQPHPAQRPKVLIRKLGEPPGAGRCPECCELIEAALAPATAAYRAAQDTWQRQRQTVAALDRDTLEHNEETDPCAS